MIHLLKQEAESIYSSDLKKYVLKLIDLVPINSWKMPSSRDHHMVDERGEWGNLIHTVRVYRICCMLADILELPIQNSDLLKSAAMLHDVCKHGINAEHHYICKEHPQLVTNLIDVLQVEHNPDIENIIGQHMGRWGAVKTDWKDDSKVTLALLLHIADCIEARLPQLIIKKEQQ